VVKAPPESDSIGQEVRHKAVFIGRPRDLPDFLHRDAGVCRVQYTPVPHLMLQSRMVGLQQT
jgi:hypothetical protein